MKNKIILVLVLLMLTGCIKEEKQIIKEETKQEVVENKEYIDDNPITIGIYESDINLVKEYKMIKQSGNEVIFSFYYTNEENLGSRRQKDNWNKFYNMYTEIEKYKIGFHFSFYEGDTKIEKTILKPDTYALEPYFYTYIYDDINQPDYTFYSHLEETDINESTIFSSIKIFLRDTSKITSKIDFTVFTYDDLEDFDENNNYRGNSKYTIKIDLV